MQERIYFRLVNTKKLPYNSAGLSVIENEIRAVLAEAIANGFIADNPAPVIKVPNVLSIEPNLKALRTLEGIEFNATLAGALHKVSVLGFVSI